MTPTDPRKPLERMLGTIVSFHLSADTKLGGGFGEIRGEDGRHYTYDAEHLYRNSGRPDVGAQVSFEVVDHIYAANIDRTDMIREPAR